MFCEKDSGMKTEENCFQIGRRTKKRKTKGM